MNLRQELEQREDKVLSPHAARSARSKGRLHPEDECNLRPAFQHDRDRILYSKAFRRLKHKTQVFLAPTGRPLPHPPDPHPWRWARSPGPWPRPWPSTKTSPRP